MWQTQLFSDRGMLAHTFLKLQTMGKHEHASKQQSALLEAIRERKQALFREPHAVPENCTQALSVIH
ncbi:hypothetical protein KOR42_39760 [Thalassoglobus neptunius]|uniref:Uncharacterized protein n=1 Tax=Thalassoglobus neptunius TaxID=1938619 RepID=A0A5C5WG31_9PLAN|nr:hypothetical protein KOR42_39760 [Thalassoglobus neptunius]